MKDLFGGFRIRTLKFLKGTFLTIWTKKELSIHFHSLSCKNKDFKTNATELLLSSCLQYRDLFSINIFAHRDHNCKGIYIVVQPPKSFPDDGNKSKTQF